MLTLDLTDDEARALMAHLRHALEYNPYLYAPRLDPLKAIPCEAGTAAAADE